MKKLLLAAALLGSLGASAQQGTETLKAYYGLSQALASDNAEAAAKMSAALSEAVKKEYPKEAKLAGDAAKVSSSTGLEAQREGFAAVSTDLYKVVRKQKVPGATIFYQYCPMKKAYWLSSEKTIRNPYYGAEMLSCGKVVETIQ